LQRRTREGGDAVKVWPQGKRHRGAGAAERRRPHPPTPLADWVLRDEDLLVQTRFGGDRERYGAWRDGLWAEIHDSMLHPGRRPDLTPDEEYVVRTAFDGDRAAYRRCRDRLREELWQIMKVTREH
jgi:hypothetical protein